MEEEECDYRTPIGKVIKHINILCKKPQVDDQLNDALDLFNKKLEEQEKYLVNGIFNINFTEAALFIQSSIELYGKKIDVLWDELLELHTRLITYDCEHQREKGLPVNKEVIEKLEERRNRYKRKKKFKLILPVSVTQNLEDLVFDVENEKCKDKDKEKKKANALERVRERQNIEWRGLEIQSMEVRKIPNVVYKQMTQMYMLRNYHVLKCLDFEIWDPDDDEFNTRYSRVPGWHHTQHLFEYNDKGLLPDHNNTIARLRLTAYGRIRFLASRNIPFNTPFEQYREEYMIYRQKFFEEEAKKWQNMPLNTLKDLRRQLQYLVQRDREINGENHRYDKLGKYNMKSTDEEDANDKIQILDTSDEDSLFELSFSCDKNFMKSDLFVRLEKLSADLINTKLRQDSGFYEFSSDNDNDCDGNLEVNEQEGANENASAIDKDLNRDSTDVNQEKESDIRQDVLMENTNQVAKTAKENDTSIDSGCQNQMDEHNYACPQKLNDNTKEDDSFETMSFISDHDYCANPPTLEPEFEKNCNTPSAKENVEIAKNDSKLTHMTLTENNMKNKNENADVKTCLDKTVEETITKPLCGAARIIPKIIKITRPKEKQKIREETDSDILPPKRRKLSQKQIDKLLKSKIKPVKEMKFEKFFSQNYQPQLGEGEIAIVDYESEEELDLENLDVDFPLTENLAEEHGNENCEDERHADDNQSVHSVRSDHRSIHSDHDYCQPLTEDSGFLEASSSQASEEDESAQKDQQETSSCQEPPSRSPAGGEKSTTSADKDCQKLLALYKAYGIETTEEDILRSRRQEELQQKAKQEARERVEEWRNTITPILKNLKDQEFDIHEYGSRIMDKMEINQSKPFSNIVQGKSSAEVVRYFISSLQLANTNNIEICGAKKGELSNDTYEMKLLTKDRYHEHLNEFLAPSTESLREKLDRMRAMDADRDTSCEPAPKKIKLKTAPSKGKRVARVYTKKKVVVDNKKTVRSASCSNTQIEPSISKVGLSLEKSVDKTQDPYQLKQCTVVLNGIAQEHVNEIADNVQPQEKCNEATNAQQQRILSKGKSIIKRQIPSNRSQEPFVLNSHISMPFTSRHVHWSDSSTHGYSSPRANVDMYMPSTSFQRFSPSPDLEEPRFSHNINAPSTSTDVGCTNKQRRESTEESFIERLVSNQEMHPDMQLQSTPNSSSPSKQIQALVSKRSLLFE